jgi:hypothetical protein
MTPNDELLARFQRLMPRSRDLTLVVLKGHLLIEEQLHEFLRVLARFPDDLERARLSFAQHRNLVQALCGYPKDDHVGRFIDAANALRNRLAHAADVDDLAVRVDTLLAAFYEEEFEPPTTDAQRATMLRHAFAYTCGVLSGFARGFVAALAGGGA